MSKKIHEFNDMIRKLRKEVFGKGPERIHTVFVENMAVSTLYGYHTDGKIYCQYTRRAKDGTCCKDEYDSGFIYTITTRGDGGIDRQQITALIFRYKN